MDPFTDSMPFEKLNFCGIGIHNCVLSELITFLDKSITEHRTLVVYGTSLAAIGRVKWMPELINFWEMADLNIVDGGGIKFFEQCFGIRFKEHVGLPNVTDGLLELSSKMGYKVFLLGGTEEINRSACFNINKRYSSSFRCEGVNGYFSEDDEEKICRTINSFQPNILLVGMTSPKKEKFVYKWKGHLNCQVLVLCGGVIDIYAMKTKREPKFFRGLPLSWLYRFIQEPRRLFRPLFMPVAYFLVILFPRYVISKYFFKKPFQLSKYQKQYENTVS